ncbi:MAG: hypothetical protein L0H12_03605 [Nitrosospira sp.]|nr:hypothetical protein [Nitrosospira sp.]
MIVQIDACRFTSVSIPLEDEPPLLLMRIEWKPFRLPCSFSKWLLGGIRKFLIRRRVVDYLDFTEQAAFKIGWDFL